MKSSKNDRYGLIGFNDNLPKLTNDIIIEEFSTLELATKTTNTTYQNYEIRDILTRGLFYVGRLNPSTQKIEWIPVID